jgi:NAD(P)-dependent dehydrogenase (short-subunit alcohol dehydrogenase family)
MSDEATIIFGGRSEIATGIANELSRLGKTFLVTRKTSDFPKKLLNAEVELVQGNLEADSFNDLIKKCAGKKLTKVCFAHRTRSNEGDEVKRYIVEVLKVKHYVEELITLYPGEKKRVIVMTSPASQQVLGDQDFQYHANKAALLNLVRYFAFRHASDGLIINSLAPGSYVRKARSKIFYRDNPHILKRIQSLIPGGELTSINDISSHVRYLLSDSPSSLNGTHTIMDSGLNNGEASNIERLFR